MGRTDVHWDRAPSSITLKYEILSRHKIKPGLYCGVAAAGDISGILSDGTVGVTDDLVHLGVWRRNPRRGRHCIRCRPDMKSVLNLNLELLVSLHQAEELLPCPGILLEGTDHA